MKYLMLTIVSWFFGLLSYKAQAQDENTDAKKKKETQEIIIRKSGEKDTKLTIELTGDKVIVNGKPLMEFKEDGITINNRKMLVREGNRIWMDGDALDGLKDELKELSVTGFAKPRTFLGVVTEKADDGVRITEITEGSPAEKAGLEKDDIITKVEDSKISSSQQLAEVITKQKAGDEVKVYFKRGKKEKSVKAKLGEKKDNNAMSFSFSGPGKSKVYTFPNTPVVPGQPMDPMQKFDMPDVYSFGFPRQQKLGLKIQDTEDGNGVKIMNVDEGSAAEKAGLKTNDIVTEIGGQKITNTDEAREWLQDNNDKSTYSIKAKRDGKEMSFDIKIAKKLKTTNL